MSGVVLSVWSLCWSLERGHGQQALEQTTWTLMLPSNLYLLFSRKEISKILRSSYLRGMNLASFFVASKNIVFVTFTTYVLLGHVITASHVFVAVTLYGAVRLTVTLFFPAAIEKVSEAVVSIRRIKVWQQITLFLKKKIFFNVYLSWRKGGRERERERVRDRESVRRVGAETEGDPESEAGSRLPAVSTEPYLTNCEIMT